jgi:ABC-type dipeptide/oligopeptide/nickel transport system ATPase subunit
MHLLSPTFGEVTEHLMQLLCIGGQHSFFQKLQIVRQHRDNALHLN